MRVALVYDRLNKIGGAEAVLVQFHKLYPNADWYTSVWDPKKTPFTKNWQIKTSWLSKIPVLKNHHEWIPFLMPFIFEFFDFSSYDLVISIGSAESKGVITGPGTIHLNYCLTPTRYLYSHKDEYLKTWIHHLIARLLTKWDLVASARPDEMIAISTQVKKRVKSIYHRDVPIIFPPVNVDRFSLKADHKSKIDERDYFLVVSRLVPYKRIDILVKAAAIANKKLIIIGEGSELENLQKMAGSTVKFLGFVDDKILPSYYQNCLAYLQANEEDFGISMCEAQASGRPVIAYGKGGAEDIVIPGKTGLLLQESSVSAFAKAMVEFDTIPYVPSDCQQNSRRFDQDNWIKQINERINLLCQKPE